MTESSLKDPCPVCGGVLSAYRMDFLTGEQTYYHSRTPMAGDGWICSVLADGTKSSNQVAVIVEPHYQRIVAEVGKIVDRLLDHPPLTDKELDELAELLDRATPAPWRRTEFDGYSQVCGPEGQSIYAEPTASTAQSGSWSTFEGQEADWELATTLRNAAPRLVAEVRRARALDHEAAANTMQEALRTLTDADLDECEEEWERAIGDPTTVAFAEKWAERLLDNIRFLRALGAELLRRFEAKNARLLVLEGEREACATIAEAHGDGKSRAGWEIAKAIRARSEEPTD